MHRMTIRRFASRLPGGILLLQVLSLAGIHLVLMAQYRVAAWIRPAWVAYTLMGGLLALGSLPWWFDRRGNGCATSTPRDTEPDPPHGIRRAGPVSLACAALTGIVAVGLILRWRWMRAIPIEPAYGDMLPLIQRAARTWLEGGFPYRTYHFPWPVPLTFPPALWMAFLPLEAAGLDLRYVTLACLAGIGSLWLIQGRDLAARAGHGRTAFLSAAWIGLVGAYFLSPLILRFVIQGHTAPYWLVLTLLPWLLHTRRNAWAAVCLGILCAMRQPAVLFVPLLGWYWLRAGSWRRATGYVAIAGGVAVLFYAPFVVRDAGAVGWEPLRHYAELGRKTLASNPAAILETIGFSNLFYLRGWERILTPLALLTAAGIVGGNLGSMRSAAATVRVMALMSLGFTLLAPFPWYYEYFPILILFMQAWWMQALADAAPMVHPSPARSE